MFPLRTVSAAELKRSGLGAKLSVGFENEPAIQRC